MRFRSKIAKTIQHRLTAFCRNKSGAGAMVFALSIVPLWMAMGVGINYSRANIDRSRLQQALDSAVLAGVMQPASTNAAVATSALYANLSQSLSQTLTNVSFRSSNGNFSGTATTSTALMMPIPGFNSVSATVSSTATMMSTATASTPVCILITDTDSGHTLKTANVAKLDVYNCMVQVNTDNWDAVQADGTSYIHIDTPDQAGNWNCFVGNIHFGDVSPAKQSSCTLLPDPFAAYAIPALGPNCADSAPTTINSGTKVFNPGTYCNAITISGSANVTFNPGIYIFAGDSLIVSGASNVTANGVVFILTGAAGSAVTQPPHLDEYLPNAKNQSTTKVGKTSKTNASGQLQISTTGTVTLSPYAGSANSQFNGFVIFQDQSLFPDSVNGHAPPANWQNATIKASGVIYMADVILTLKNVQMSLTGSLIADGFLPEGTSVVSIMGTPTSPLQKVTSTTTVPRLVN